MDLEENVLENIKKQICEKFKVKVSIDEGIIKFTIKHNNTYFDKDGKLNQSAKEKLDKLLSEVNKESENKYYYKIKENKKVIR